MRIMMRLLMTMQMEIQKQHKKKKMMKNTHTIKWEYKKKVDIQQGEKDYKKWMIKLKSLKANHGKSMIDKVDQVIKKLILVLSLSQIKLRRPTLVHIWFQVTEEDLGLMICISCTCGWNKARVSWTNVAISFFSSLRKAERLGGFKCEWCGAVEWLSSVSMSLDVDCQGGTVKDAIALFICSNVVAIIVLSMVSSVFRDSSSVA